MGAANDLHPNLVLYHHLSMKAMTHIHFFVVLAFIGGGKANEFSYHEIQPYAVSQNAFEASNTFKFVSHVLKDGIALYSNVESFVIVNDQSLKVLTPKFTIADLKTVAASYGVFFHSKMNHRTLQLAIRNHVCHNCSTYVSVFEFMDKKVIVNERKLSHSIAVRKSRRKDPEKYKSIKVKILNIIVNKIRLLCKNIKKRILIFVVKKI